MRVLVVIILAIAFALGLGAALLELPQAPLRLAPQVEALLPQSGVAHPVTAVLLNFRGYDTLLEVAVLLIALLIVLAAAGSRVAEAASARTETILPTLAATAAPLALLAAVYVLWAGAHRPGGAFQAGAVLAAVAVLLHLVRRLPAWSDPNLALRIGLAAGFAVFLGIAALLTLNGALLTYPPQYAGMLILVIEASLTLSLGLILAGLFLFLSREDVC